jgi:hypothetical protein
VGLIKPFGLTPDGVKTVVEMPQQNAAMFTLFEQMLEAMGLAYQLRCRKCNERGEEGGDYCWGNNETNATQLVVECHCTRRVYRGANATAVKH